MNYELATQVTAGGFLCRERRSRYRTRDHYGALEPIEAAHPVSRTAERRVLTGAGRARFRRVLALSEELRQSDLPPPARAAWLELEALLHAHWLAVAREHYNLGVDAGLLRALDPEALAALPVRERLVALMDALRRAIDEL